MALIGKTILQVLIKIFGKEKLMAFVQFALANRSNPIIPKALFAFDAILFLLILWHAYRPRPEDAYYKQTKDY